MRTREAFAGRSGRSNAGPIERRPGGLRRIVGDSDTGSDVEEVCPERNGPCPGLLRALPEDRGRRVQWLASVTDG